jgi:hypothetical protein
VAWVEPRAAAPTEGAEARAALLAVSSLSDAALVRLAQALDDSVARAERAGNPLLVDLDDDTLDQVLEAHLPTLNAATHLAHARFRTDDGLAVAVGARCEDAPPGARCVGLWQRGGDDLDRRIRFLAWPFTCAAVVQTEPAHLAALSRALRDAVERPDGTIALVIEGEARAGAAQLRASAQRALAAAEKHGARPPALLAALTSPPSASMQEPSSRLLHRGSEDVVVVPRLGALSRLSEFNRELSAILANLGAPVRLRHPALPID